MEKSGTPRNRKKVSAFAVAKALENKQELQLPTDMVEKIASIHKDEKFNKAAEEIAANYVKNRAHNLKKKKQKEELKAVRRKRAAQDGASTTDQPAKKDVKQPTEKPLSWYNAPKSEKRVKLTEDPEVEVQPFRENKKRGMSLLKEKNKGVTPKVPEKPEPVSSEVDDGETENLSAQPLSKPAITEKNVSSELPAQKTVKKSRKVSKKVEVKEWTPPSLDSSKKLTKSRKSQGTESLSNGHLHNASSSLISSKVGGRADATGAPNHSIPETEAKALLTKLLYPESRLKFFKNYWLKKPLHIQRKNKEYYFEDDWFSMKEFHRILSEENVRFGVNLDITSYVDGERDTAKLHGRAFPAIVYEYYEAGHSVRLLNPQTYSTNVWRLLSSLQELFGSMTGANVYLTPPGTQGFAPHYDDIEAFVLQLEGKKHWKVYKTRHSGEKWPLTSSPNLTQEELSNPLIDCVLEPGDLLYMPRGAIHQAMALEDEHSLHITLSTHQQNTWSNLLHLMLPIALNELTQSDPEFRESLPIDFLNYTGIALQDASQQRDVLMRKVFALMNKLQLPSAVDDACDALGKRFIHDSLPPFLTEREKEHSIAKQGGKWVGNQPEGCMAIDSTVEVRLLRKHSIRVVNDYNEGEDDAKDQSESQGDGGEHKIRVYYNTDNDRLYHGNELQFFMVNEKLAPGIEYLQRIYPDFVQIAEIPDMTVTAQVDMAQILYDYGLLITKKKLK